MTSSEELNHLLGSPQRTISPLPSLPANLLPLPSITTTAASHPPLVPVISIAGHSSPSPEPDTPASIYASIPPSRSSTPSNPSPRSLNSPFFKFPSPVLGGGGGSPGSGYGAFLSSPMPASVSGSPGAQFFSTAASSPSCSPVQTLIHLTDNARVVETTTNSVSSSYSLPLFYTNRSPSPLQVVKPPTPSSLHLNLSKHSLSSTNTPS